MEEFNEKDPLFFSDEGLTTNAKIKVIGVGGGGSNAVNQMINDKKDLVQYIICNTDAQALAHSECQNKYVLGKNVTRGLGAGGNPDMGRKAAEDSYKDLQLLVKDADMVFIACGEGGGTGTGAAPVVAKAAKEKGCLVLAIVTRPFNFEGKNRRLNALQGISELKKNVDAIIVVSNDKLVFNNGKKTIKESFREADEVLARAVKTVTDLILLHGTINLDFADVKSTLQGKGISLIGIGTGVGKNKAIDAASNAINSPLLEASIKGAKSMILNVTVGDDTSLDDVQYAINYINEAAGNEANIIWGLLNDETYHDKMTIAIIATDFSKELDFETETKTLPRAHPITADYQKKDISNTEKEMKKDEDSSPLPDYLRRILMKKEENKKDETPITEELKNEAPKTVVSTDIPVEKSAKNEKTVEFKVNSVSSLPKKVDNDFIIPTDEGKNQQDEDEEDDDETIIIPIDNEVR